MGGGGEKAVCGAAGFGSLDFKGAGEGFDKSPDPPPNARARIRNRPNEGVRCHCQVEKVELSRCLSLDPNPIHHRLGRRSARIAKTWTLSLQFQSYVSYLIPESSPTGSWAAGGTLPPSVIQVEASFNAKRRNKKKQCLPV